MKTIFFVLAIFFFTNCTKQRNVPDRLSKFLTMQLSRQDSIIRFTEFSDVVWTKLYVLTPYTGEAQFNDELTIYKDDILRTGIKELDDRNVLVLFNNNTLVSISIVPRTEVDFSKARKVVAGETSFYTKADAIFNVRIEDNRLVVVKP